MIHETFSATKNQISILVETYSNILEEIINITNHLCKKLNFIQLLVNPFLTITLYIAKLVYLTF